MLLQPFYIDKIITTALEEDIHYVDVTTDYLLDDDHTSEAYYLAKDTGVLCGIDIAKRVSQQITQNKLNWLAATSPWKSSRKMAKPFKRETSSHG